MLTVAGLVVGAAVFYVVTMLLMKHWGVLPPLAMAVMIAGALALGSWCEIEALKVERLSAIYVAILGVECLLISLASFAFLGEQVSVRELTGGLIILTGVFVAAT